MKILTDEMLRSVVEYINRDLELHGVVTENGAEYRLDLGKLEAACESALHDDGQACMV